jgi:hypothetical protein
VYKKLGGTVRAWDYIFFHGKGKKSLIVDNILYNAKQFQQLGE